MSARWPRFVAAAVRAAPATRAASRVAPAVPPRAAPLRALRVARPASARGWGAALVCVAVHAGCSDPAAQTVAAARGSGSAASALAASAAPADAGSGAPRSADSPDRHGAGGSGAAPIGSGGAPPAAPTAPGADGVGEPRRLAYSLVDNRLAAHRELGGGLAIAAGSAGFAKYVRFGNSLAGEAPAWQLQAREGVVPVARLVGKQAAIYAPLTAEQAASSVLGARVHSRRGGRLRIRVNGAAAIERALAPGWSTAAVSLPAGQLRAGENEVALAADRAGLAVAWIRLGGAGPLLELGDGAPAAGAQAGGRDRATPSAGGGSPAASAGGEALALVAGERMAWYVLIPAGAHLVARVASAGESEPCALRARVESSAGAVVEGALGPGDRPGGLPLAPLAGQAARVELALTGCARGLIRDAGLAVAGQAPEIPRGPPPRQVLFVILDSLRVDRVRAFEPRARAETPVLERLARTGTLFTSHYVQGNESQVSHASMWTSMYLARHRAARWQHKLSDGLTTLDDVAAKAGLYPVGATGNGYIRPARGFGTEWRRYANHIEQHLGLRGDAIIAQGLTFLTGRAQEPWLLYLGLIDTHVPWRAKQPWLDRYSPDYRGRYAKVFGDDGGGGRELTEAEREHVRAIYDSNISYLDDQLGKLIAKLEAWGVWESTMLIVTADHGDELWEAGRVGHESGQDDTLLHVPLLVHYPPLFPGARVSVASEGVDLLPTIAEALGVVADPAWQGISLIPAAHGANSYPGIVSASGYERQHGARLGTWKLRLEGTRAPALFDLAIDPHELRDVFGAPGAIAAGRAVLDPISLLRAHHASWRKARWGNPGNVTPAYAADHGE